MNFNCQHLITLFNDLFKATEQTILIGGGSEPLYLPKEADFSCNQIIFTQDYFASALHEVAHWCIAGAKRRTQVDYGYWYSPDGRTQEEQQLFEQVEIKPQAIEWIFAVAAGSKFNLSADNLTQNPHASRAFEVKVYQQTRDYLHNGLPKRAELFKQALLHFYQRTEIFGPQLFSFLP